jgi:hypothetical protein
MWRIQIKHPYATCEWKLEHVYIINFQKYAEKNWLKILEGYISWKFSNEAYPYEILW